MWMFPAKLHIWYKAAYPICSMYGISTYMWVIFRANVGKYSSTMEHMGMLWQMFSCECLSFFVVSPIRSILDTLPHCRLPSHLATSWLLTNEKQKVQLCQNTLDASATYLICWEITSRIKSQFSWNGYHLFCRSTIDQDSTTTEPTEIYIQKTSIEHQWK